MNIELMKELEDLNNINKHLGLQLNAKIEATVKRLVSLSLDDFERFFKSKGFQVQKDHRNANASYGIIKASLTSQPDEGYIGYTFVFDLIIGPEKYDVIFASDRSGIASSAYSIPNDPDEKLKQEIRRIRESNQRALNRINSFDSEQWRLVLKPQTKDAQARRTAKKFSTMYDLLASLNTQPQ